MSANRTPKVVVADYDYGDVGIERSIVAAAGFELAAAQAKSEDEVIAVASDADAVLTQYAEIGKRAIDSFKRVQRTSPSNTADVRLPFTVRGISRSGYTFF
jgi:hypothetical protein